MFKATQAVCLEVTQVSVRITVRVEHSEFYITERWRNTNYDAKDPKLLSLFTSLRLYKYQSGLQAEWNILKCTSMRDGETRIMMRKTPNFLVYSPPLGYTSISQDYRHSGTF
ncbi:hypothetical protein J6590_040416 [Homalodisca vitripennis]|nr:hypothetical protein J6590_040416 [Homalodisca vitripennis]